MYFGLPGTINSSVSSQGITVMGTSQKKMTTQKADDAWKDIFDSLVIDNEPPVEYIKRVIIITKDGNQYKVTAQHFAQIIEQEKHLTPEESEIRICKMSIDYNKLRADIDRWAAVLFSEFDGIPLEPVAAKAPRATKPRTAKVKPVAADDSIDNTENSDTPAKPRRGKAAPQ